MAKQLAKKQKSIYRCKECNSIHSRWEGRCSSCGEWNSIQEEDLPAEPSLRSPVWNGDPRDALLQLSEIPLEESERSKTGIADLDLVLGGGFVSGSLLLLAGEPGIGKSTLMLEICRSFPKKVYYFSGEESVAQTGLRARRLGLERQDIFFSRESNPVAIAELIRKDRPGLALVDSIQTLHIAGRDPVPGMVVQLRESAMLLLEAAKDSRVPVLLSGHITKEGNVAGPKLLEHMVDAVLYFESDRLDHYRMLRATKNRFGAVGEVALFEMHARGLRPVEFQIVENSEEQEAGPPGQVISAIREGSRSLVVEVQALVSRSPYGPARRMAEGLDSKRLMLMGAVLEKFLKLRLAECDIFANLVGGLNAKEPALDLALCAAILSSYHETPFPRRMACIGEVGLSGEVRPLPRMEERLAELIRMGYTRVYCSAKGIDKLSGTFGAELIGIRNVTELNHVFHS